MDKIYYQIFKSNNNGDSDYKIDYKNINSKVLKKVMNDFSMLMEKYNIYESGLINQFIYDILVTIDKAGLTSVQMRRMNLWIDGYTENEIAEMEGGVSRWVVSKSIHSACEKIIDKLAQEL